MVIARAHIVPATSAVAESTAPGDRTRAVRRRPRSTGILSHHEPEASARGGGEGFGVVVHRDEGSDRLFATAPRTEMSLS